MYMLSYAWLRFMRMCMLDTRAVREHDHVLGGT